MKGAGYINEISYNKAMLGIIEGGKDWKKNLKCCCKINQFIVYLKFRSLEIRK